MEDILDPGNKELLINELYTICKQQKAPLNLTEILEQESIKKLKIGNVDLRKAVQESDFNLNEYKINEKDTLVIVSPKLNLQLLEKTTSSTEKKRTFSEMKSEHNSKKSNDTTPNINKSLSAKNIKQGKPLSSLLSNSPKRKSPLKKRRISNSLHDLSPQAKLENQVKIQKRQLVELKKKYEEIKNKEAVVKGGNKDGKLEGLIIKWKNCCKEAMLNLQSDLKKENNEEIELSVLLSQLQGEEDLFELNEEGDDFL